MISIETICHVCKQRKYCYLELKYPCCEECAIKMDSMSDEEFENMKDLLK